MGAHAMNLWRQPLSISGAPQDDRRLVYQETTDCQYEHQAPRPAALQVVTCSGVGASGSLRIVRNGIGMIEQATVELPGAASPTRVVMCYTLPLLLLLLLLLALPAAPAAVGLPRCARIPRLLTCARAVGIAQASRASGA